MSKSCLEIKIPEFFYINEKQALQVSDLKIISQINEASGIWIAGLRVNAMPKEKFGKKEIKHLSLFKNLQSLDLSFSNIKNLSYFKYAIDHNFLENLKSLSFSQCFRLKKLNGIECFKKLESLDLTLIPAGSSEFAHIGVLKELITLNLAHTAVPSLEDYECLAQIREMNLACCKFIQSSEFAFLNKCKKIRKLNISHTYINSLDPLLDCKELEYIEVKKCIELSAEDITRFQLLRPDVQINLKT